MSGDLASLIGRVREDPSIMRDGEDADMNSESVRSRRTLTAPFFLGVVAFLAPATSVSAPLSAWVEAGGRFC